MGKYRLQKTFNGFKATKVPFYKEHETKLYLTGCFACLIAAIIIRLIWG